MNQEQENLRTKAEQIEAAALKSAENHDIKQALLLNKQLLEIARALKDGPLEYKALRRCGDAAMDQGDLTPAMEFYRQAQSVARAMRLVDDEGAALLEQAQVFAAQGKKSEASRAIQEAVSLATTVKNKRVVASFLNEAAYTCGTLGAIEQGLGYLEQAEALNRDIGNLKGVAATLSLRSHLYRNSSQIARALEVTLATLELRRALNEWSGILVEYSNIARLYQTLGEPEKALSYLLRGLSEGKSFKLLPEEAYFVEPKLGQLLNEVSLAYQNLGKIEEALRFNKEAFLMAEKRRDPGTQATLLEHQASLRRDLGQFEGALKALNQALILVRSVENRRLESGILVHIASLHSERGDLVRASAYYEQALPLQRAAGELLGVAHTLQSLAQGNSSNPQIAREYFQEALAIYRGFENRMGETGALVGLARLEKRTGQITAAESAYKQAIALSEQLRTDVGEGISGQGTFFEGLGAPYIEYLTLLVDQGRAAEAFAIGQKTRARGLLDLMAGGKIDLSRQLSQAERAEEQRRRAQCDSLAATMVREAALNIPGSKKRFEAAKKDLAEAERNLAVFQDTLYARYPGLGQRRAATTASLEQVAKALPNKAALLEFAALDEGRMTLFVVTRNSGGKASISVHQLNTSKVEREQRIQQLRTACVNPRNTWQIQARQLYKTLLAPVETRLRGCTQLILCPDGVLWDVPFAVLLDTRGTPLLERFALSYAGSATLWHAARTLPRRSVTSPRLLVLANPRFDTAQRFQISQRPITVPDRPITVPDRPITVPDRPITVPDRDRLVDLPGTQREADALARRFPNSAVFTRSQAQESLIKRRAGQFQRLHIASHAFVNDAAPLQSAIVLANPSPGNGEDGFLTARELCELDLSGIDMTVLSACSTARGVTQGGEGVVGLTWALFVAGCPTQVLSQWAVNDASTATLMAHFYTALSKGEAKGTALRQSALALRREKRYAHPYFWAPFVLIGDSR